MSAEQKFCRKCGKPMEKELVGEYSPETGDQLNRLICSAKPCEHSGHDWSEIKVVGFWNRVWASLIGRADMKCSRCGKLTKFYMGD